MLKSCFIFQVSTFKAIFCQACSHFALVFTYFDLIVHIQIIQVYNQRLIKVIKSSFLLIVKEKCISRLRQEGVNTVQPYIHTNVSLFNNTETKLNDRKAGICSTSKLRVIVSKTQSHYTHHKHYNLMCFPHFTFNTGLIISCTHIFTDCHLH